MIGTHGTTPTPTAVATGPCGPARTEVDSRCRDAERLAQAAANHQQRLRDARLQLADIVRQRELFAEVRDRRALDDAKNAARVAYHDQISTARSEGQAQEAAAIWLREINRLNRQVVSAERNADDVARRASELEGALPGIELAADAARIAAEGAEEACRHARLALAACEERVHDAARPIAAAAASSGAPVAATPTAAAGAAAAAAAETVSDGAGAPADKAITLMLRGDRQMLLGLALRMSEETGVEAGRLQLLLLELREAVAIAALNDHAYAFQDDHPFWGQFDPDGRRAVVDGLAALGYRFDGRGGWADGHAPNPRDLAMALSHAGFDSRTLRRPAGQAAIDALWQGTTVTIEDYLLTRAPELTLEQMTDCLGPRAAKLGDLWDNWGRLRPMLRA